MTCIAATNSASASCTRISDSICWFVLAVLACGLSGFLSLSLGLGSCLAYSPFGPSFCLGFDDCHLFLCLFLA